MISCESDINDYMDENNKPYEGEIPFVPEDAGADKPKKADEDVVDVIDTASSSEKEASTEEEPVNVIDATYEEVPQGNATSDEEVTASSNLRQDTADTSSMGQPSPNGQSYYANPPQGQPQGQWSNSAQQQNGWQSPPPQQTWQAQPQQAWQPSPPPPPPPPQNGWQQNNWQAAPQNQSQQNQPQQTQWSFHDYGPVSPRTQGNQPKEKKTKKPKEKGAGRSFKVLAIIMSALFILSVAGFSGYMIWDDMQTPPPSGAITGGGTSSASSTNSPSMNITDTPNKPGGDVNGDGSLSGKEVYAKVSPSVVGIAVYTRGMGQVLQSQGSGIILSEDGYLVTNCHVVSEQSLGQQVVKIEVIMPNGDTYEAKNVGEDSKTDLAVLKMNGDNFPAAEFGNSSQLNLGDRVYVIGNPSGIKFSGSMTQGIVSSLSRSIYISDLNTEIEYIQTDAAINTGNSGGAFINEYGQVVGISAAKMRTEAGYEGMGFAIPIDNAKDVVNSLIENGYVTNRPMIGIQYIAISETLAQLNGIPRGLRVHTVQDDSDAYAKGVKAGDIITKMDGKDVYDTTTVAEALKNKKPSDTMVLTVYKVDEQGKGATVEIPIILMEQKPTASTVTPEAGQ